MEAGAGEGVGAVPSPLVPPPPHISALRAASSTAALISCSTKNTENKINALLGGDGNAQTKTADIPVVKVKKGTGKRTKKYREPKQVYF
jgi:hypothetical protein